MNTNNEQIEKLLEKYGLRTQYVYQWIGEPAPVSLDGDFPIAFLRELVSLLDPQS